MKHALTKTAFCLLMAMAVSAAGCAAKKDVDDGKPKVNHPKFESFAQLYGHLKKVYEITVKEELDGEPVDMSWIDPAFRERICLVVTINNHCVACHAVHSRAAKDAGLSTRDIKDLLELSPDKFGEEEYAALAYVRDWTIFSGEVPFDKVVENFEAYWDEQERRDIIAVATVMSFANKWNNTMTGQVLDESKIGEKGATKKPN